MLYNRHKIPTIFNIYMLDVVCCALGCVILLWQVSHQEAEEQTASAKSSHADAVKQFAAAKEAQAEALKQAAEAMRVRLQYEKAQTDFLSASKDVVSLQATVADWRSKYENLLLNLAMTEKEREEARKLATARQDSLDKTRTSLTLSEEYLKKLETQLAKLLIEQKGTKTDLAKSEKINIDLLERIAALKIEIASRQTDIDKAGKKAQEQLVALKLSEEQAKKLQALLDAQAAENKSSKAKLSVAELQLMVRQQELAKARQEVLDLIASKNKSGKEIVLTKSELEQAQRLLAALALERDLWRDKLTANVKDKDKLNQRILDLQAQIDQRFAGIPLTGKNVIFLIDVSGSMARKDEDTDDPEKWPFVCETLMRLMRSIPTLENFQVILFSDKTRYLFDGRDRWWIYDGATTAKQTHDALRKEKVEGGTDMHAGFDEAFRYRKLKLDTIYVLSDGLPNLGPGLPPALRDASESQRSQALGKFVRDKLKNDWNRPQAGLTDVRVNAVGFFFESPDVGAFLWAMAREHKGSFVGLR